MAPTTQPVVEPPAEEPAAPEAKPDIVEPAVQTPEPVEPSQPPTVEAPVTNTAASSPPPTGLSDKEIARRLRERQDVPVTVCRDWQPKRKGKGLPPDGRAVIGRIGWIKKQENSEWYEFVFLNDRRWPYEEPRRLLPCQLLEEIERLVEENQDVCLQVSGETTNDSQNAYLLLQRLAVVEASEFVQAPVVDSAADNQAKGPSTPATQSAEDQAQEGASALKKRMLDDRPGRAVRITPSPKRTKDENIESVAPAGRTPFTPGKKDIVVDRVVRIVKDADSPWWEARFESDNTLREPPLRLYPCLRLTQVQDKMRNLGFAEYKICISGEISYYKGRRYLLLRKILLERDMGQF
jgi:hypothetical protein